MIPKRLEDIELADLQALVDEGEFEGKRLEFKRDPPQGTDKAKDDFRGEVAAFANTVGGDLVVGIEEGEDGRPKKLVGFEASNVDDEKGRVHQILEHGVKPRLPRVDVKQVVVPGDRWALVVRVPRSWAAPHRVGDLGQFYARNSRGKYPMDVGELRTAFTLAGSVTERMRTFRAERVEAAREHEKPLSYRRDGTAHSPVAAAVLHLLPLGAFAGDTPLDLFEDYQKVAMGLQPLGGGGWDNRPNLDGVLTHNSAGGAPATRYTQLFRSGAVEAYSKLPVGDSEPPKISLLAFERALITACSAYLPTLDVLGTAPPVYAFFSVFGVKECHTAPGDSRTTQPLDRDVALFPEVAFGRLDDDPTEVLRPLFDAMWNAFGLEGSPSYDEHGNRIGGA